MKRVLKFFNDHVMIITIIAFVALIATHIVFPERWKEIHQKDIQPEIVVVDGCEYLYSNAMFGAAKYVHKENCKNNTHANRK